MKIQFALALGVIAILALVQGQDVGLVLEDPRIVQREIKCILEKGACDVIGRQIKDLIPGALNNDCQSCNPRQKRYARQLIQFMKSNYPDEWDSITKRYSNNNNN